MNLHNVSQVSSFVVVREWISLMELQSMSDFRKEIVYACRQISIFHYLVFEIFMATFAVIIFANPILCFFFSYFSLPSLIRIIANLRHKIAFVLFQRPVAYFFILLFHLVRFFFFLWPKQLSLNIIVDISGI